MKKLIILLSVLAITSMACSFTVNLPSVETTETKSFMIDEKAPKSGEVMDVDLTLGAAEVNLAPGGSKLIEGTSKYNVPAWEPVLNRTSSSLSIEQRDVDGIKGIPSGNLINNWDLEIGNQTPIALTINAVAFKGEMDFSGIPITELQINDGASTNTVIFDQPNPIEMGRLEYTTGASTIELTGLGNANFEEMRFNGGAGTYTLDFSGDLRQDASVSIEAGVSTIRVIIPDGVPVTIEVRGELKNVRTEGTWTVNNDTYISDGTGKGLTIRINMNLGSLVLEKQ
jgi:hypothetical protein